MKFRNPMRCILLIFFDLSRMAKLDVGALVARSGCNTFFQ